MRASQNMSYSSIQRIPLTLTTLTPSSCNLLRKVLILINLARLRKNQKKKQQPYGLDAVCNESSGAIPGKSRVSWSPVGAPSAFRIEHIGRPQPLCMLSRQSARHLHLTVQMNKVELVVVVVEQIGGSGVLVLCAMVDEWAGQLVATLANWQKYRAHVCALCECCAMLCQLTNGG